MVLTLAAHLRRSFQDCVCKVSAIVGQIRLPQAQQETSDNFGHEFRHRAQGPTPSVDLTHCDCRGAADDHFVARRIPYWNQLLLRYLGSTWAVYHANPLADSVASHFFSGSARLRPSQPCSDRILVAKFIEQCFRVFQVGGVEALGEPVVDFREHRARLVAITLLVEQPRETRRRAQFP